MLPRITDELAQRCSTALGKALYPSSDIVVHGSRGECAPAATPTPYSPGFFWARAHALKDAPYAENSNDSAWLANTDRPLTGYGRVFGPIGSPLSSRARGAKADVSAMAAKGELTVRDLQAQQFANRATSGDLIAADTARACAARCPVGRRRQRRQGRRRE